MKDKKIAGIQVNMRPELVETYPILKTIDLSGKTLFGLSFLEIPDIARRLCRQHDLSMNNIGNNSLQLPEEFEELLQQAQDAQELYTDNIMYK